MHRQRISENSFGSYCCATAADPPANTSSIVPTNIFRTTLPGNIRYLREINEHSAWPMPEQSFFLMGRAEDPCSCRTSAGRLCFLLSPPQATHHPPRPASLALKISSATSALRETLAEFPPLRLELDKEECTASPPPPPLASPPPAPDVPTPDSSLTNPPPEKSSAPLAQPPPGCPPQYTPLPHPGWRALCSAT